MTADSATRIAAIARKDAAELIRNPGAILPALAMMLGSLVPAFLVVVMVPFFAGESLEQSGAFRAEIAKALMIMPELSSVSGNAQVQAFVFLQFSLILMLVPIVAAGSLATHAVIGEKQSRSLEPLLATPVTTVELLLAKTLTPFVFGLALTGIAAGLYFFGMLLVAEPGVWRAVVGTRMAILLAVLAPLVELAALQVSVIVSSRTNDPRSAQQMTSLLILPVTFLFVAQMMGAFIVGPAAMLVGAGSLAVLNAVLLWIGIRVFHRETILTRWR
jgi:ABC-2 type transport system permease protein